jgi:hypothetical protein
VNKKNILRILIGLAGLLLLIKLLTILIIEPYVGKKILAALNARNIGYEIAIDKVHILILSSGIELKKITISSQKEPEGSRALYGEIASIKFLGLKLAKALIRKDIDIKKVTISESNIKGKLSFPKVPMPPIVSPLCIRIDSIIIDRINLSLGNTTDAESYIVKEGNLKMYDFQVEKQDTLSPGTVKQFDIDIDEFVSVSDESLYTSGVVYSANSQTLLINSFNILPNYKDYEFTSRHKFQKDRIEAGLSNIYFHDFNASDYISSDIIKSSYIEIGKLDMKVFCDMRKEFRHVKKPAFQDMIYNYPGIIQIDSAAVLGGNIIYKVHDEEANEPGSISFNEIDAKFYQITNDTIFKTRSAFMELNCNALLMGKSKLDIILKSKILDSNNTFSLNGTLSELEVKELNPILEKNAFIYATSGKIEALTFSFTANNTKSSGKLILLYHGLKISMKNKRTDDTTAFKERIKSIFANMKILDSNPIREEEVRDGVIDYERDPERFIFNYCFKSIISGIKSSLVKSD